MRLMDNDAKHQKNVIEEPRKAYTVKVVREKLSNAYGAWTEEDDERLRELYKRHQTSASNISSAAFIEDLAAEFARSTGAIYSRIGKLFGEKNRTARVPIPEQQRAIRAGEQKIKMEFNAQFRDTLRLLEETNANVFVTGRAGTGKSTFLDYFRVTTKKRVAVLAPTGVAALNVRGQTIHSFFRFGIDVTPQKVRKASGKRGLIFQNLDALIIDEISMVRADLLDCVDKALRVNREDPYTPFGGVQMIFVGDLYQLPPVVPEEEGEIFTGYYPGFYFFDARVMQELDVRMVELTTVYRQKDEAFIRLLNAVRSGEITDAELADLNTRWQNKNVEKADFSVVLTTRTALAEQINLEKLAAIRAPARVYEAIVEGDFKEKQIPTHRVLKLKPGAQVMLLNNDSQHRWVNGTLGKITALEHDEDGDRMEVQLQNGKVIEVAPHTWEMTSFYFDKRAGAIASRSNGSFTQYPLKLAWAVTIHKAQGKTFDQVVIDIGEGTFAHGQMYVALSRATTLEGITLRKPIERQHIFTDKRVAEFLSRHSNGK